MNAKMKILIVAALVVVVGVVIATKQRGAPEEEPQASAPATSTGESPESGKTAKLPRLVELGSTTCIPCKMMKPILDELRQEYEGRLQVDFIDVKEDPAVAMSYGVQVIPTQIFFDASEAEVFRHEGFFAKEDILAKWKEVGVDLRGAKPSAFERLEAAKPDTRSRETVCYMCEGGIVRKTLVAVRTDKGVVRLCSPHCYFILYSCLTEDRTGFEEKVSMTDYATGNPVAAEEAVYLVGADAQTGRPWTEAFADKEVAETERKTMGGDLVSFAALKQNELSHRCGFCDRACYPQDAARVIAGGVQTWGCCSHCALGVAARTGLDIEVYQPDRLTGEMVVVKTLKGSVASLEPKTAVAWFGLRKKPDGSWGSAGCFRQGFFANAENLKKWLEANPYETGRQITIQQALADKMKLTPQQILKACKIGECAPK